MLFNSMSFLLFFPLVVLGYFLVPGKVKQYWLLAASYYFYMSWNAKYGLLIFHVRLQIDFFQLLRQVDAALMIFDGALKKLLHYGRNII